MRFIKLRSVTLAVCVALAAASCATIQPLPAWPPFPSLPDAVPADILALNLVPERDPNALVLGEITGLGFSDIERMTVRIRNIRCTGLGTGTGFAIDPFTIITNRHVLEGAETLEISTFDGRDVAVTLADVVMSDDADIAIIRVNDPLSAYVTPRRGQLYSEEPVTVIGFPEGGQMTVTEGKVLGLIVDSANHQMGSVILTDAQVLPGSSGSPLLDAEANLIGVIYARTDDYRGLAVPIEMLDDLLAGTSPTSPLVSCRV
jgi:S1-C subfamily serine protease